MAPYLGTPGAEVISLWLAWARADSTEKAPPAGVERVHLADPLHSDELIVGTEYRGGSDSLERRTFR